MSVLTAALARVRRGGARGFTLVELLVASMLFMLLSSMVFTTVVAGARTAKNSREYNDLNEEARLLLNRMSRELREAQSIGAVTNPGGAVSSTGTELYPSYYTSDGTADTSVTFNVDFNGNDTIEPNATDPETLTYKYDRANRRVLLLAAGESMPVLAAEVESFTMRFTSRVHAADGAVDGTYDGVVNWEELDADTANAGGNDNHVLDGAELSKIDSITIEITVLKGDREQTYRTQVDLRNRPY
ncbi:MAG TPA: prepilin-type N-terminal cleavage/methylation domain-containing protein [Frankiaceae bacterium]|nr:prepilin-type N-terminal cleavage/methylation domain-containing protein [Frankiaceae bacterium]